MPSKKLYSNRRWLNSDKTQTAFIACEVEKGHFSGVHGEVKIADCAKIINLELYSDTKKEARQRLRKLDILIEELFNVREAIHDVFWEGEDE